MVTPLEKASTFLSPENSNALAKVHQQSRRIAGQIDICKHPNIKESFSLVFQRVQVEEYYTYAAKKRDALVKRLGNLDWFYFSLGEYVLGSKVETAAIEHDFRESVAELPFLKIIKLKTEGVKNKLFRQRKGAMKTHLPMVNHEILRLKISACPDASGVADIKNYDNYDKVCRSFHRLKKEKMSEYIREGHGNLSQAPRSALSLLEEDKIDAMTESSGAFVDVLRSADTHRSMIFQANKAARLSVERDKQVGKEALILTAGLVGVVSLASLYFRSKKQ